MTTVLKLEILRSIRADGSTPGVLVADVNAVHPNRWERHEVFDAIDELIENGDLRRDPDGRFHRVVASAGMTPVEERLDAAWPRVGGRPEVIRALADEMQEVVDERDELRTLLTWLRYDMHKVFGNTSRRGRGIGGQAMTEQCLVLRPEGDEIARLARVDEIIYGHKEEKSGNA